MTSTNIITKRTYPDGSIGLAINGRDIPDAKAVEQSTATGDVYFHVACGQFNDLHADAPAPRVTIDTELVPDGYGGWILRAKPKLSWLHRFERWLNDKTR